MSRPRLGLIGETRIWERSRFSGQTRDGRYCRARYYHPGLQRFISEDPIGFAGGDVNLYGYVANSPVNRGDPLGLIDYGGAVIGLAGVAGGAATIAVAAGVGAAVPPSAPAAVAGVIVGSSLLAGGVAQFTKSIIEPSDRRLPELPPVSPVGLAALLTTKGNVELANKIDLLVSLGTVSPKALKYIELVNTGKFTAEELAILAELIKVQGELLRTDFRRSDFRIAPATAPVKLSGRK
jgi:RHS repeat-associated protein